MTLTLSHKERRLVFLKGSIVLGIRLNYVALVVEHVIELVIEPQSPFFDVGLVLLVFQLVGDDYSKLVVGPFGTCIRSDSFSFNTKKLSTLLGGVKGFDELTIEVVDVLGLRAAVVWLLVIVRGCRFFNSNVS